jgi:hypothetical protein
MNSHRAARWLVATVSIVCVAVVGSAYWVQVPIVPIQSSERPRTTARMGELVATSRVCQTFVAQHDGLARLEVLLTDQGREASGPFHFYLRTVPDADQDLVSLTHDASEVDNDVYHVFEFPPIQGSGGQRYSFCMEAPEAELEGSITAMGTAEDWYPEGEATLRDMWVEAGGVQDLDFRLGYRLSLRERGVALSDRLVAGRPFLCGAKWFYALLGMTYLILLYVLLSRSVPARENDPD